MIEKGQLIFFVYPCDSLSGVSFCSSFIGFYPLFSIFVIVLGILFDYQRIIFNSHENGQRIRKCQTVQNHYIPHAFK